ncbi:Protein transport protein Sec24-like [Melia azedarach]|uniref:Protein transport protein Sec24-like n=1 Tax=Melia azedarach TaxID=155640 RepID=A0ACC1Y0B3_MELAZ|nr:Protein transport protein Sec24-like [Melia azedarach]
MAPAPSFLAKALSKFHRPGRKADNNENVDGDIESLFEIVSQSTRPPPFSRPNLPPNFVDNPPSGALPGPRGLNEYPPSSVDNLPVCFQQQMVSPVTMPPLSRMAGMPAFESNFIDQLPLAGLSLKDKSEECPHQMSSSSVIVYETRQGKLVKPPPPVTTEYIVKDTGNCSPNYMRCTLSQIPCTGDLLKLSSIPLALIVQPLALPHPSEEPIQVVDFGESGPVRCCCCKGYMNPFMEFIDHGKCFICNFCGTKNETPLDYYCYLGTDGRRLDADERPELCRGTVEFTASKEFMMRDPMPPVYFFLIDVSVDALQTGTTAAACTAVMQVISDLPEGPRTMVGIATFNSSIQFYSLKPTLQQPLMLVVADTQDVYAPLQADVLVALSECRQNLEQLLEGIPTMFQSNNAADSAFGAAIRAAFLAMKTTGGKLLVFQSVRPSVGIGSCTARENEGTLGFSSVEKDNHKLLKPEDKLLGEMAREFAENQVCVDIFIMAHTYVDIASISVISKTTGGQVYYYYPFSVLHHSPKLYNDLRWNITRPQGFEATMRVRCSEGLQIQECWGNFFQCSPTEVDLPGIDCDKSIMVSLKVKDKFLEGSECAFQSALLYTTIDGQRRIRVSTLSLPCTNAIMDLFLSADLDAQLTYFLKLAANEISARPTVKVRLQLTNFCINIAHSYREFCARAPLSGHKAFPETLKLLPLYILALIKSAGLQSAGRIDDRSYWISRVSYISVSSAVVLIYPRMMAIHSLLQEEIDGSLTTPTIPLTSAHINDDGIYLLENGEDALIYVGDREDSYILDQLFGTSLTGCPTQFIQQQYDNSFSRKLNDLIDGIRRLRSSYLSLHLCRKGDPLGMVFHSYMIEDGGPETYSYQEFILHINKQVQARV